MLALRVAARWQLRQAVIIGDPVVLVRQFEKVVSFLAELEPLLPEMRLAIEAAKGDKGWHETDRGKFWRRNIADFMSRPSRAFGLALRAGMDAMFLAILQQYHLPAKIRKVIERGSKAFARSRMQRSNMGKAVAVYTKTLKTWRGFLDAAKQALVQGKEHAEGEGTTKFPAGPFTLINTGGFADDVMQEVVQVVTKAAQLLTSHGLGRVCYGDMLVSNTVGRSARILAFYIQGKDEMFVRANLKGKKATAVETICHELGHRLHFKFLTSKDRDIQRIYARLAGDDKSLTEEQLENKANHPKPGETMVSRGKTYEVVGMGFGRRYNRVVNLQLVGDPERTGTIPLSGWMENRGLLDAAGVFVSAYAKKNHEENFAEMIAHYCTGTLPEEQIEMLEALL